MAQGITWNQVGQDNTQQAGNTQQNNNNQQNNSTDNSNNNGSQQNSAPQGGTGPTASGGQPLPGSSAPSAGNNNNNQSGPVGPQQRGTGYVNVQKLIQANQGNQLGSAVSQGIQNQGQNTQNNLNQQEQQFSQGTQASAANTDANSALIQQGLSNPTSLTPQQQQQFQALMSGQYSGPTALNNAGQLQAQAQNAAQLSQNLNTSGGREQVLQQMIGGPGYTSGQASLDQLLLGQAANNPQLAQARQSTAALNNQVNNAVNAAQAIGQEQGNESQQFGQNVQNMFGQNVNKINEGLQTQAAQSQANRNASYQQMLQDAATGNLTQAEANLLGLTGGEQVTSDILGDIGAGKYTTENAQQATAQNIANQQQYATIDALRQLAGNNAPQAAQQTLQQYANQDAQAGTWAKGPLGTTDTTDLNNRIQANVGDYNSGKNWVTSEEALGLNFKNWANGTLTAQDLATAASIPAGQDGFNPQIVQAAQQGDPMARAIVGQMLWNHYLDTTYAGTGGIGGNSRGLTTDYGNWAYSNAVTQGNKELAKLQGEYGNLQNVNITDPTQSTPSQDALSAMAQGTVINPNR